MQEIGNENELKKEKLKRERERERERDHFWSLLNHYFLEYSLETSHTDC